MEENRGFENLEIIAVFQRNSTTEDEEEEEAAASAPAEELFGL